MTLRSKINKNRILYWLIIILLVNNVIYSYLSYAVVDTVIDVIDLRYDTLAFAEDPTLENAGWLLVDGLCIMIPYLTSKGAKTFLNGKPLTKNMMKSMSKGDELTLFVAKSYDDVAEGAVTIGTHGVLSKVSGKVGAQSHHFTGKRANKVAKYLGYESENDMLAILLEPKFHANAVTKNQNKYWRALNNNYNSVFNICKVKKDIINITRGGRGADIVEKWIPSFEPVMSSEYKPTFLDGVLDWILFSEPVYSNPIPVEIQRSMWINEVALNFDLEQFVYDINGTLKPGIKTLTVEDFIDLNNSRVNLNELDLAPEINIDDIVSDYNPPSGNRTFNTNETYVNHRYVSGFQDAKGNIDVDSSYYFTGTWNDQTGTGYGTIE